MKHTLFKGMATAMVTPMTSDGVDYATLAKFIEFQIIVSKRAAAYMKNFVWKRNRLKTR